MIKPVEKISTQEATILRLKKFLNTRAVGYTLSALAAIGVGKASQNYEREFTGFNPVAYATLKNELNDTKKSDANEFTKFKEEQKEKNKKSLLDWFSRFKEEVKKGVSNPSEYIKDTTGYKKLLLKYYNILDYLDDAAFLFPALITFVMLGGFIVRKLDEKSGDPAKNKEMEDVRTKLNEVISAVNSLVQRGEDTLSNLNEKEIQDLKDLLQASKDILPHDGL